MIRPLLFALCLPAAAGAEVWVDNPAACAGVDLGSEGAAMAIRGEENTLLFPEGMEAIEYYCGFESPVDLTGGGGEMQVRAGYCMEPGPFVWPTVFVIGLGFGEPGEVHVWDSADQSGEPHVFHACSMQ